jgi:hypothetical protein
MMDRYNFTEEEWRLVVAAPYIVGVSAIVTDVTPASLVMEIAALGKIVKQAAQNYGQVALIQSLAQQDTGAFSEAEQARLSGAQVSNLFEMFSEVLMIVDRKADPGDAQEYRYFLYEVGEKVTQAAGEGLLGIGPKTSDREYDFLAKLEEWLEI